MANPSSTDDAGPELEVFEEVPDRAMVVFAHPDDGELGAGGVIGTWSKKGCEFVYVACTTGSSGSNDREMASDRIVTMRRQEQMAAAEVAGVRHVEFLDYGDGFLEDTREFLGQIVRLIRKHEPHTVLTHDPYRLGGIQHRDHRKAGITVLDAVYPFARDHLHFPEHLEEGLDPHKVRQVLLWGADQPDVIVDTTQGIEVQIEALRCHDSQVGGLEGGDDIGHRLRRRAGEAAAGFPFPYGQAYRRLTARA